MLDLGAGSGALTAPLLAAGARVLAVELHPGRVEQLLRRFPAGGPGSGAAVEVRRGDLLTTPLPQAPYRVVANPPWSLLESLRERLLRSPSLIRADIVVPRWVARKWARQYPRIGIGGSVPREAFCPSAPAGAAVAIVIGRRPPNADAGPPPGHDELSPRRDGRRIAPAAAR